MYAIRSYYVPIEKSEEIMVKVNEIIKKQGELLRISGSIGSEAGVMSIGSGSGIDHISVVATYVDRYKREADIWQISKSLREAIAKIPNVKYLDVTPYGATALASIRASVDAKLSSNDINSLQAAGNDVQKASYNFV